MELLVIDDDGDLRYSLERVLSRHYTVLTADSGEQGLQVAKAHKPPVILMDNRMGGMSGMETLQHLRHTSPKSMVILMTAFGTTQTAIEAMKFGAFDYIIKPFDLKKLQELVKKAAMAFEDLNRNTKTPYAPLLDSEDYREGIVGSSEPMQEVFKIVGQVAASDVTVMITGESGTGKELVAKAIYQHSHRASGNFVAVNCAAIPDNLIESELFGHEKGAFTGATAQRKGKFELCDGGTIFLDEIGDMALPTQTKILRALQEGEIQRVGGTSPLHVDVRLIAATNKDLEAMVAEKTFREDLFYRLNVVRLRLPSLRERKEDIPALTEFMLQRLAKERKVKVVRVSSDALACLQQYDWPGNVRELENVIYRSAVVAQGEAILLKDLPQEIVDRQAPQTAPLSDLETPEVAGADLLPLPEMAQRPTATEQIAVTGTLESAAGDLTAVYDQLYSELSQATGQRPILETIEIEMMRRALADTGGNQAKTSALLGMTRATLRKRMELYGLSA
jgi:two-component system nitrogen regulation response regulator GlnG